MISSTSVEASKVRGSADAAASDMVHEDGAQARREELVLKHLNLVRVIAKRLLATLPKHLDLDDLVQAGTIGLLDAAHKYDRSKDVDFGAYAKHRIRGAILDSLRSEDPVSRDMRRDQKKIESAAARLEQELKRKVTEAEIATALKMDLHRIRMVQLSLSLSAQIPLGVPTDSDLPEFQYAGSPEERPDVICAKGALRAAVQTALAALPERQRKILHHYYHDEMTMVQIGTVMGVNESRVSQIHKAAVKSVGQLLAGRGYSTAAA